MKRALALILALLLSLSLLPGSVLAEEEAAVPDESPTPVSALEEDAPAEVTSVPEPETEPEQEPETPDDVREPVETVDAPEEFLLPVDEEEPIPAEAEEAIPAEEEPFPGAEVSTEPAVLDEFTADGEAEPLPGTPSGTEAPAEDPGMEPAGDEPTPEDPEEPPLNAPEDITLSNREDGIRITWSAVAGVENYMVIRRVGDDDWSEIGTAADTEFIDLSAEGGVTYIYNVCCVSGDGSYTSDYSSGQSITRLANPVLGSAVSLSAGVTVTWKRTAGAQGYAIYRRSSGKAWTKIASVDKGSTVKYVDSDVTGGTNYTYTVRAVAGSDVSYYDRTGVSVRYVAAPVIASLSNGEDGIKITWSAVAGAGNYRVFRLANSGRWAKLGDTTDTAFTDTTAKPGVTYTYTVRCVSRDGSSFTSGFLSGKSLLRVPTPELLGAVSLSAGVTVTWKRTAGAQGYAIYRRSSGKAWTKIASVDKGNTVKYVDSDVTGGTNYTYTVRAVAGSDVSYYDRTGVSVRYVAAPVIASLSNLEEGIKISWAAVTGAENYRVFRLSDSGRWAKLGDTAGTAFTDTTVRDGVTYTYTVRCVTGDGKSFTSGLHAGKSLLRIPAPELLGAVTTDTGVKVSWSAMDGADKYLVYRKSPGGAWTKIAAVGSSAASFKDTSPIPNETNIYTVRAVFGSVVGAYLRGGVIQSGWASIGKNTYYVLKDGSYHTGWLSKDGEWYYFNDAGVLQTGWVKLDGDWYYFFEKNDTNGGPHGAMATNIVVDNWLLQSNGKGVSKVKLDMIDKAQGYSSSTSWLILVDTKNCYTGVFKGSRGNWTLWYYWQCSPGASSTPTVLGTFTVQSKGYYFDSGSSRCYYYTQFYGNYLFHSTLYWHDGTVKDSRLGLHLSHGCVRLAIDNARWIYNNIPWGTKVVTYS